MIQELLVATMLASSTPIDTRMDFDQGAVTIRSVREFERYLERPESESVSATRPRTLRLAQPQEEPWIGDVIDALIDNIPEEAWENVPSDLSASIDRELYGKG